MKSPRGKQDSHIDRDDGTGRKTEGLEGIRCHDATDLLPSEAGRSKTLPRDGRHSGRVLRPKGPRGPGGQLDVVGPSSGRRRMDEGVVGPSGVLVPVPDSCVPSHTVFFDD